MPKILPKPTNPERICCCDKYCPADELACANGRPSAPHPIELFGDDWLEWIEQRTRRLTPRGVRR